MIIYTSRKLAKGRVEYRNEKEHYSLQSRALFFLWDMIGLLKSADVRFPRVPEGNKLASSAAKQTGNGTIKAHLH